VRPGSEHHGAALVGLVAAEAVDELDHVVGLEVHVAVEGPHAVAGVVVPIPITTTVVLLQRQPPYSRGRHRDARCCCRVTAARVVNPGVEAGEGLGDEPVLRHEGHVLQHEARVPLCDVLHLRLDQHLLCLCRR
jgi:hypothetical protein